MPRFNNSGYGAQDVQSLGFQTPYEEVFGTQKPYQKTPNLRRYLEA